MAQYEKNTICKIANFNFVINGNRHHKCTFTQTHTTIDHRVSRVKNSISTLVTQTLAVKYANQRIAIGWLKRDVIVV